MTCTKAGTWAVLVAGLVATFVGAGFGVALWIIAALTGTGVTDAVPWFALAFGGIALVLIAGRRLERAIRGVQPDPPFAPPAGALRYNGPDAATGGST